MLEEAFRSERTASSVLLYPFEHPMPITNAWRFVGELLLQKASLLRSDCVETSENVLANLPLKTVVMINFLH